MSTKIYGQYTNSGSRTLTTVDNEELIMEDEQWERGGITTEQGEESWFMYGSMDKEGLASCSKNGQKEDK